MKSGFWVHCLNCGFKGAKISFHMVGLKGGLCKLCHVKDGWKWTERKLGQILDEGVRDNPARYTSNYINGLPDKLKKIAKLRYKDYVNSRPVKGVKV